MTPRFTDNCRLLLAKIDTEDAITTTWLDAADNLTDNIVIRQKRQPSKYLIVFGHLTNIGSDVMDSQSQSHFISGNAWVLRVPI